MLHKPNENNPSSKVRAPRNRTLTVSPAEERLFSSRLLSLSRPVVPEEIENCTINQDLHEMLDYLPPSFVDLLFVDPPYHLNKEFRTNGFKEMSAEQYEGWVSSWLGKLATILKPNASVYVCGDWRSSGAIARVMARYFVVRNRITWEREKGRGAKTNWKSSAEDIWFGTVTDDYTFNIDTVKLKRKVIAPYREGSGKPKDWVEDEIGGFRITHPSNLWTDLTVPFWSMPENTDHPTQKPEKLLAKVILASSNPGDFVFDPFLGSGTTSVVAKKMGRRYCGVETDKFYCCLAEKRLALAESNKSIQGYCEGVFWERNSLPEQKSHQKSRQIEGRSLFPAYGKK